MPHRKVFHLIVGVAFILSMYFMRDLRWFFLAVLMGGTIVSFIQDRRKLPVITWFLDRYEKKSDRIPGEGPLTFFFGAVFVWFVFPEEIAIISLLALTFGDPMACTMGSLLRGPALPWNANKSWLGTGTFVVVSFVVITPLFGPGAGLIAALSAGIAESVNWPLNVIMDDNIMVPVVTSSVLWLFDMLFLIL